MHIPRTNLLHALTQKTSYWTASPLYWDWRGRLCIVCTRKNLQSAAVGSMIMKTRKTHFHLALILGFFWTQLSGWQGLGLPEISPEGALGQEPCKKFSHPVQSTVKWPLKWFILLVTRKQKYLAGRQTYLRERRCGSWCFQKLIHKESVEISGIIRILSQLKNNSQRS